MEAESQQLGARSDTKPIYASRAHGSLTIPWGKSQVYYNNNELGIPHRKCEPTQSRNRGKGRTCEGTILEQGF